MNPTIELNGLEVQLGGRTILHGLTGGLKSRAIGLLGPNGAGKSTLITRCWASTPRRKGAFACLGWILTRMARNFDLLSGTCREERCFISKMSGFACRYWRRFRSSPGASDGARTRSLCLRGIRGTRYRPVGTFLWHETTGEAAQAIAMVPGPDSDEPTNGMTRLREALDRTHSRNPRGQ